MTRAVTSKSSTPLVPWHRSSEEADKKARRNKVAAEAEQAIRNAVDELNTNAKEITR